MRPRAKLSINMVGLPTYSTVMGRTGQTMMTMPGRMQVSAVVQSVSFGHQKVDKNSGKIIPTLPHPHHVCDLKVELDRKAFTDKGMNRPPGRNTLKMKAVTDSGTQIMLISTRMVESLGGVQLDRALLTLTVANKGEFKHRGQCSSG